MVKRMQAFFPSFFSSTEDIKGTFLTLSQIDDIREQYVDGTFKGNKDEIIESKLVNYFKNSAASLKKDIAREKGHLADKASALQNSNIEEMEQRQKSVMKLIKDIESGLQSKINMMDDNAERIQKECWNSFSFRASVPTTNVAEEFECKKRWTFGLLSKTITCEYRKFNKNTAADTISQEWENAINMLSEKWNKGIAQISDDIQNKLKATIKECQKGDTDGLIDARVMYNILDESYTKIKNNATLNTKDLIDDFKNELADSWNGIRDLPHYINETESEARSTISELAAEQRKQAESALRQIKSAQEDAVIQELKRCREAATSVLKGRKNEFNAAVEKGTKDYLGNLGEQLKDKKENLRIMKESLDLLDAIEKSL